MSSPVRGALRPADELGIENVTAVIFDLVLVGELDQFLFERHFVESIPW